MKLIERSKKIKELGGIEAPYNVWVLFHEQCRQIMFTGDGQVSLGEDFKEVEEIRKALDWYVEQFDGKVKWKNR